MSNSYVYSEDVSFPVESEGITHEILISYA